MDSEPLIQSNVAKDELESHSTHSSTEDHATSGHPQSSSHGSKEDTAGLTLTSGRKPCHVCHHLTHRQDCPRKRVTCTHCQKEVKQKNLSFHLEICPKRSLPCCLRSLGCNFTGEAAKRLPHQKDVGLHLPIFCKNFSQELAQGNKLIAQKVENLSASFTKDIFEVVGLYTSLVSSLETIENRLSHITTENEDLKDDLATMSKKLNMENVCIRKMLSEMNAKLSVDINDLCDRQNEMASYIKGLKNSMKDKLDLQSNETQEHLKAIEIVAQKNYSKTLDLSSDFQNLVSGIMTKVNNDMPATQNAGSATQDSDLATQESASGQMPSNDSGVSGLESCVDE